MFFLFGAPAWVWIGFLFCAGLGIYATFKVQSAYAKYSQVPARVGLSGAEVANEILQRAGSEDWAQVNESRGVPTTHSVRIQMVPGMMTDHYDPINRVLRLSPDNFNGTSLAACCIAAHEAGHAVQHAKGFVPLHLRTALYPLANIGTRAWPLLMIAGWFFGLRNLGILSGDRHCGV